MSRCCRRFMTTMLFTNFYIGLMARCCPLLPLSPSLCAALSRAPLYHSVTVRASFRPCISLPRPCRSPPSVLTALRPHRPPPSPPSALAALHPRRSPPSQLSALAALRPRCSLPSPLSALAALRPRRSPPSPLSVLAALRPHRAPSARSRPPFPPGAMRTLQPLAPAASLRLRPSPVPRRSKS
jgi:hypothetical protein